MDVVRESQPLPVRRGHHLLLPDHHRRLDARCQALIAQVQHGDPAAFAAPWRRLEAEILEHMAAEEDVLVPTYTVSAPEDAQRILQDHLRIRQLLVMTGAAMGARETCRACLRELVAVLAAHAAHEDKLMYPWAQRHLPHLVQRSLFARFVRLWFDRG